MALTGQVQEFGQAKEGANDLDLEALIKARPAEFRSIAYRRTRTDSLTLQLTLVSPGWGSFLIREVTGFVATYWFFAEPFPLKPGDKLTFTTSGAQAGESHAVLLRTENLIT